MLLDLTTRPRILVCAPPFIKDLMMVSSRPPRTVPLAGSQSTSADGILANLLSSLKAPAGAYGVYILHSQSASHAGSVAASLASIAVCLGTRDESCPCGNCRSGITSCRDIFHVRPNEHGNVLAGSFDGINEFLGMPPLTGSRMKVLLVESLDKVTATSASSLLKLLEDQAILDSTLVLFTTSSYGSVPPPLRSRAVGVALPHMEEPAMPGGSLASQDLGRSSRWLSNMSGDGLTLYVEARKALPFIIGGIKANDPVRAWKSLSKVSRGPQASVASVEVLSLYMSDLLASACTAPGTWSTITGSDKLQASEDATSWGVSALASLSEDLSAAIRNRLPGQDLSSFLYRWVLKACELASKRTFRKAAAVQVLEVSSRKRDQVSVEDEPVLALDGDESFKIDFGDC